ncbi:hypothetical protein BDP27DRAFT_1424906 [Rhodocollybia butyracea]|uniref:Protein kinase domain-containing protein n=1 Tax=Rhodocollybia butyracea TaxID=206335 RepID=A0A9P5U484_9AGAR|nr:hypothetical protein BDP27DRAFT_1424906 [Rhodocollybia butyracea]
MASSTPPATTTEIMEHAQIPQARPLLQNRGSSRHVSCDTKHNHNQSDCARYSKDDGIPIDDFLLPVCGCIPDTDWINRRQNGSRGLAQSQSQSLSIIPKLDTSSRGEPRYAPFVALTDGLGDKDIRPCSNYGTSISGTYTSRNPYVAVVCVVFEGTIAESSKSIDMEGFRNTLSLPSSSTIARKRLSSTRHLLMSLKHAEKLTKMILSAGFHDFVVDLYTKDENIQLFHVDHSAVIFSRPVTIVENIGHLLHLLDAIIFTRRGISSLIDVAHNNVPSSPALGAPYLNLFPGVSLSLLNGTFCFTLQYGIIDRGSCVIRKGKVNIASAIAKGAVCIVKLTRQARLSELALIDNACKLASSLQDSEWVLHHLPTISHSADLPLTPRQVRLASFPKEGYGQRILRITVMTDLLPIAELTNPADLKIVFRDIFRCYRWLVEEAKILHRNVNVANITFQYGSNGSVYGVLNDFDHAIRTDVLRSPSSHRTGTAPYMAIDILRASPPPIHLYRHDLESLYYVLVCTVCPADDQLFETGSALEVA